MRFRDQREQAEAVLKGTLHKDVKDKDNVAKRMYRAAAKFPHPEQSTRIGKGDNERPLNYDNQGGIGSVFSRSGPRRRVRGVTGVGDRHPAIKAALEARFNRELTRRILKRDKKIGDAHSE